jgi:hypothetical protein
MSGRQGQSEQPKVVQTYTEERDSRQFVVKVYAPCAPERAREDLAPSPTEAPWKKRRRNTRRPGGNDPTVPSRDEYGVVPVNGWLPLWKKAVGDLRFAQKHLEDKSGWGGGQLWDTPAVFPPEESDATELPELTALEELARRVDVEPRDLRRYIKTERQRIRRIHWEVTGPWLKPDPCDSWPQQPCDRCKRNPSLGEEGLDVGNSPHVRVRYLARDRGSSAWIKAGRPELARGFLSLEKLQCEAANAIAGERVGRMPRELDGRLAPFPSALEPLQWQAGEWERLTGHSRGAICKCVVCGGNRRLAPIPEPGPKLRAPAGEEDASSVSDDYDQYIAMGRRVHAREVRCSRSSIVACPECQRRRHVGERGAWDSAGAMLCDGCLRAHGYAA